MDVCTVTGVTKPTSRQNSDCLAVVQQWPCDDVFHAGVQETF